LVIEAISNGPQRRCAGRPERLDRSGTDQSLDLRRAPVRRARRREERYLIVACTVITDVPEALGP